MRRLIPILFFLAGLAAPAAADDALSAAANQSFLAANAARPGVVSRPDGLQYRILASGFGKRPGPTDTRREVQYCTRSIRRAMTTGFRMKSLPPTASPAFTSSVELREVRKAIGT